MDFLDRMTRVIDHIEEHINDDFDFNDLSGIICCNVYQFGRIFSYVVGISLAEYVRNRRLSLAALELSRGEIKVIDVALKYGYSSPESFARAFKDMHGVSPREAAVPDAKLRMYPRITFYISIKGDMDMEYKIVDRDVIKGVGIVKNFGKFKINEQAEHWTERMHDVWLFWDHFLDYGENIIIRDKYKLYKAPLWQMGVNYTDPDGNLVVSIGAEDGGGNYPELTKFEVPASTWAVFTARGTLNQSEHPINALTTRIFME
jgi:AraC family transcriptional regulator